MAVVMLGIIAAPHSFAANDQLGGFRETSHCIVQGYVYSNPGDPTSFSRADGCPEIRDSVKDNMLLLVSPQTWVAVVIPASGGNQRFFYKWGSEHAHIGPHDWTVSFGRIMNG